MRKATDAALATGSVEFSAVGRHSKNKVLAAAHPWDRSHGARRLIADRAHALRASLSINIYILLIRDV